MISTTHILLMVCYALSSSRTVVCLDDDMGLRVFNTADGKTLCEVKLKDYVVSGQFACKFDGKDANIIDGGKDTLEMEIFSYKTNKAYKTRVQAVNHVDESLHLGHYHKFYIDDEKRQYVKKVLVTSGVAYTMNSAFHSILDGFLWEWFGLPIFTIIIPTFGYYIRYLISSLNPRNMVRRRRFGLPGRRKPHHPPKPHLPAKPQPQQPHDLKMPFTADNYGLISRSQLPNESLFGRIERKGVIQSVKWGLLAWLVLGILSPRSLFGMRNPPSKFSSEIVPTSRAHKVEVTSISSLLSKDVVRGGAKSNRNGQDPTFLSFAANGVESDKGNALTSLLVRLKALVAGVGRLFAGSEGA